jgi:IS605 OrfB family transposase
MHAKASHYERLAGGGQHPLNARAEILAEEHRRVSRRRSNLNDALAWSAARWAVDQAITAGATVIYIEDLRSMEARGMGRTLNTRLSQTVRGKITDRMRHLAAEHGIAVVAVPARGTSKNCPRCLSPLRHCKAPDKPHQSGWKWAWCPGCGWQGDRDRREAPSPPRPGRDGQRPEGRATTARLPRAAHRDQGASTTRTPARRPHRARGAALGAGFHLHAHATPPRRALDP